jgi:hypothetical protein
MHDQAKREFELCKKELLSIISSEQYNSLLLNWVHDKSKAGFSKLEIYNILMELFKDIQTRPDPADKLYDRVADFCDGFTAWGKSFQILPDEPHVEDF